MIQEDPKTPTDDELLASAFRKILASDEYIDCPKPGEQGVYMTIDGYWSASEGLTAEEMDVISRLREAYYREQGLI